MTLSLNLRFDLRLGGYIPYGMWFFESYFPYGSSSRQHEYYWRPSREALGDAWGLLEKTSRQLKDQLEYLPASGWFKHSWGLSACSTWGRSRTTHQDYSKTFYLTTKYSGAYHTDIPGPTTQVGTGPTTPWAPGTTRLGLHSTCWHGAQGLQRISTLLGS
jgi:hypothetical protein